MCSFLGNDGGGSYNASNAKWDAGAKFGLNVFSQGLDFFGQQRATNRRNQLLRQQHERNVHKYRWDHNNAITAWRHDIQDGEAKQDSEFLLATNQIAQNQLKTWNSVVNTNTAITSSYVKMLSTSLSKTGTAGARGSNQSQRQALLDHAMKMAALSAKLSGEVAQTSLANAALRNDISYKLHSSDIDLAMGKPMVSSAPVAPQMEQGPSPLGLLANVGKSYLGYRQDMRDLTPPEVKEQTNTGDPSAEMRVDKPKELDTTSNTFNIDSAHLGSQFQI